MNIAITGSNGFIGSSLVGNFSKNREDTIIPFDQKKYSLFNIQSLQEFLNNVDIVIHLAGINNETDKQLLYKINVLGTANILEACLHTRKLPIFIFVSSFSVYTPQSDHKILDEKSTTIPFSHYGLSKLLGENLIHHYSRNYGLPTRILRLSNVYGPGEKGSFVPVIDKFIENILLNQEVIVNNNGTQERDFIYIDDVVKAIKMILTYNGNANLFNICSQSKISIIDLIALLQKKIGKTTTIHFNSTIIEKGYWIGKNNLAFQEFKFKPSVTLDKGLTNTIKWYLQKEGINGKM